MRSLVVLSVILLAVLLPIHLAVAAETLTVVADEWCPYNCTPNSARLGFNIDILKAIFEPQGIMIDYRLMDWEQALKETAQGKHGAATGGYRENFEGWVIPTEEIGLSTQGVFVKKGNPWKYNGPSSLAGKKFGQIPEYTFGFGIDEYLAQNKGSVVVASGDDPLADLMRKLLLGEIDLLIEDTFVSSIKARELALTDKLSEAGRLPGLPVYVAFSPKRPESKRHAALFDKGIRELRSNMKLAGILKKYGIADWKK
jgi:polar amino acid transport system substrate-binding protein